MKTKSGGEARRGAPSPANYVAGLLMLGIAAVIFLSGENLGETTRRGFPLWLLGIAAGVLGVGAIAYTA